MPGCLRADDALTQLTEVLTTEGRASEARGRGAGVRGRGQGKCPGGRVTNAVGTIFRKIFVGTRARGPCY